MMGLLDHLFGSRCAACKRKTRGEKLADPATGAQALLCRPCHDAALQRKAEMEQQRAKEEAERKRQEERKAQAEDERRRKEPAKKALAAVLAKVKAGQPTQIGYSDSRAAFANRVKFMELWAAEGTLPKVSLIVLDACDSRASKPFLVIRTGAYDEYIRFHTTTDIQFLQKFLPGKTWSDLSGASVANYALPGNRIGSMTEYDKLVGEIESGLYEVRCVIAIDGIPGTN